MADLLLDFMTDLNVVACDLSHRNSIGFTYERDDGIVRSWIDHIICSQSLCPSITNVHTSKSGTNLSDHLPLFFNLEISFSAISNPLPPSSLKLLSLIGQKYRNPILPPTRTCYLKIC